MYVTTRGLDGVELQEGEGAGAAGCAPFPLQISRLPPLSPGGGPGTQAVEHSSIWTLGSNPGYPTCWLCDFGRVTIPLQTSVSLSANTCFKKTARSLNEMMPMRCLTTHKVTAPSWQL